jgi:hypothetical protein
MTKLSKMSHRDNWLGPDATPVQFTTDAALRDAIARALRTTAGTLELRVLRAEDLLHEKLRAGRDPACRRSKRLQDPADAQALLEGDPSLAGALSADEKDQLDRLPG